ncbi:MAG: WbqC family protein [Deltaproteobacteria bacterium]|nr:WbqC family protein [Deltaproteobacteria bacterium]
MLVAIHQPEYLPWIGYFEKMIRAEVFVLLDDVQFSKGDFQNRTRIKGSSGPQWLSVPIIHKLPQKISEVGISETHWQQKHWKSIVSCYAKARYFPLYAQLFEALYRQPWEKLVDVNIAALDLTTQILGIEKKWILSSTVGVSGTRSDLVLNICKELKASAYYSGRTGSTYLKREDFRQAGIEVIVQNFIHPVYEQGFATEPAFIPNLSVIDLLFNSGPHSRDLLCP